MKISIITVVHNNAGQIEDCIKSVLSQSYNNIEYIIIDNESTDGTLDIINKYKDNISRIVSEKDKGHIYAMNKGIGLATGDVIAFLHSDDFYVNTRVIEDVADVFKNNAVDSLYGNLTYVDKNNTHKTIRYWKAGKFNRHNLKLGWMPPHPTFFVKRNVYKEYGILDTSFKISMDYEIMLRFLYTHKISTLYLPETLVAMRSGGVSNKSIKNMVIKTLEDYRACKMHGIKRRLFTIFAKNVTKIPQFFVRENSF